jgi:hypothetical protein
MSAFPGKDDDARSIVKTLAKLDAPTVGLMKTCQLCYGQGTHKGECPWLQAKGWMEAYG